MIVFQEAEGGCGPCVCVYGPGNGVVLIFVIDVPYQICRGA